MNHRNEMSGLPDKAIFIHILEFWGPLFILDTSLIHLIFLKDTEQGNEAWDFHSHLRRATYQMILPKISLLQAPGLAFSWPVWRSLRASSLSWTTLSNASMESTTWEENRHNFNNHLWQNSKEREHIMTMLQKTYDKYFCQRTILSNIS